MPVLDFRRTTHKFYSFCKAVGWLFMIISACIHAEGNFPIAPVVKISLQIFSKTPIMALHACLNSDWYIVNSWRAAPVQFCNCNLNFLEVGRPGNAARCFPVPGDLTNF